MIDFRSILARLTRHTPPFKGKGRIVLLLDRLVTNEKDSSSFIVAGPINGLAVMYFDLRAWGQKFAFYYGKWESEFVDLTCQLYKGGTFIDVGSSLGLYAICLGETVRKSGEKVVSVEPISFNLERQKKNVVLNRLEDIVNYHPVALGAKESLLLISADSSESDNNAYVSRIGTIEVPVTTLDRLVTEAGYAKVGFIKMDVEGFEPMVVAGGRETIHRDHPIIFAEFNRERMLINQFDMSPSWEFLMGEGYAAFEVNSGRLRYLSDPGNVENIFFLPAQFQIPHGCLA